MDPSHPFHSASSHKGSAYPYVRQQHPLTQPQRTATQSQYVASYRPTVPSGSEMPDEWGYHTSRTAHVSNVPSHVQGVSHGSTHGVPQPFPSAAPTVPTCRYSNCHRSVTKDMNTHELSEYCSKEHMQEDLLRGVPACLACRRCPRRITSYYCGSSCEKWEMERQRRHQQSPPMAQAPVPPGSFNWGSIAGGSLSVGHLGAGYQPQGPQNPPVGGLVRCPRCGSRYLNGSACPSLGRGIDCFAAPDNSLLRQMTAYEGQLDHFLHAAPYTNVLDVPPRRPHHDIVKGLAYSNAQFFPPQ